LLSPNHGISFLMKGFAVKRVLVATDFSQHADRALSVAIDYAKLLGGAIDLVHVYSLPMPIASSIAGAPVAPPLPAPDELLDIHRQLETRAARVRHCGVDCLTAAVEGYASLEIVAEAQKLGADLIVMGTHGHSGLRRVIFGSVTEHVLRKASSPVLVVPPARALERVAHPHVNAPAV
jgi:nucleotide-binding universal stress UspA family protein